MSRAVRSWTQPESDDDGAQEHDGNSEARHPQQPGQGRGLATCQHRRTRQGELSGDQLAGSPSGQPDQGAEHPRTQLVEQPGDTRSGNDHAGADDEASHDVGHGPERQALVEPVGSWEEEYQGEAHRGQPHTEHPPPSQEEPAVQGVTDR